jgi:hypothetical protein
MKRKERYIARLDEVTIIREGEYAFIEYKEEGIPRTGLQIGPQIARMSDGEIVELHNERLRAQAKGAAEYKHVAVEVPLGSAQIEYVARCDQWVPRGSVLRCLIRDQADGFIAFGLHRQGLAGRSSGEDRPTCRLQGSSRRSGRFPALPYPPLEHMGCSPRV